MINEDKKEAIRKAIEKSKRDNLLIKRLEYTNKTLQDVLDKNRIMTEYEKYGLVKGQKVSKHERIDPRTGRKFVAGQGGTGSPKKVLGELKTVAPSKPGGESGEMAGFTSTSDIMDPEKLEIVIRNIHNATPQELVLMSQQTFDVPYSRMKSLLLQLILTEILLRGILEKHESELREKMVEKEKEEQEKESEKEKKKKETEKKE